MTCPVWDVLTAWPIPASPLAPDDRGNHRRSGDHALGDRHVADVVHGDEGTGAAAEYGKTEQKVRQGHGPADWVLDVLAQEPDGGQVIRVSVAGEQPRVTQGQQVRVEGLEAIPWVQFEKKTSGTAFRAAVVPAAAVKAA